MTSSGDDYLRKFLLEQETDAQKSRRQKQQADRKKNDPVRKKQVRKMVSKYEKKTNPQSRKDRDLLATAKKSPNGESAEKLKKRGLNLDSKKCSKCGSTENVQMDHVEQKASGGYNSNGRVRWLCNKCHQPKTASEREKKGQQENQHGRAKRESFENLLHDKLQSLMEAEKDDKSKPKPKSHTIKRGDYEYEYTPDAKRPDLKQDPESDYYDTGSLGDVHVPAPTAKKIFKKRVGGRKIIPKDSRPNTLNLYYRQHPQYSEVLEVLGGSPEHSVFNDLYRSLGGVDIYRTFHMKDGSTVHGMEHGFRNRKLFTFKLRDGTVLQSESYSTDYLTYFIKDYQTNDVYEGQVINMRADSSVGTVITLRDYDGQTHEMAVNEPLATGENENLPPELQKRNEGRRYYRYGPPDKDPVEIRRYYVTSNGRGGSTKKYEFETLTDLAKISYKGRAPGPWPVPDGEQNVSMQGQAIVKASSGDDSYTKAYWEIIDREATQLVYQHHRLVASRDAGNTLKDRAKNAGDADYYLSPEDPGYKELMNSLLRKSYHGPQGREDLKKTRQEIHSKLNQNAEMDENGEIQFKGGPADWGKEAPRFNRIAKEIEVLARNYRRRKTEPSEAPKNVEWKIDPRSAETVYSVQKEVSRTKDGGQAIQSLGKGKSRKITLQEPDPTDEDLSRAVYTLQNVKVVEKGPGESTEQLLQYLIDGYRQQHDDFNDFRDWMSSTSARIPRQLMLDEPSQKDEVIRVVKSFISDPNVASSEEGELGSGKKTWKIIEINNDDIAYDEQTDEYNISDNDQQYYAHVSKVVEEFKDKTEERIAKTGNDKIRERKEAALQQAIADVQPLEGESGIEHITRTSLGVMPLTKRSFDLYNFYGENERGKWPALEETEVRQDVESGIIRRIRYAIPRGVTVHDTFDMEGNLIENTNDYGWLDKVAPSENYDAFGMRKPASKQIHTRNTGSSMTDPAKVAFTRTRDVYEYIKDFVNPYIERNDPKLRSAWIQRDFNMSWTDDLRKMAMRDRALQKLAAQRAIDTIGSPAAWYDLDEDERDEALDAEKEKIELEKAEDPEAYEKQLTAVAFDSYRMQVINGLNRAVLGTHDNCPVCRGNKYLKSHIESQGRSDFSRATTQSDIRSAISGPTRVEPVGSDEYDRYRKNKDSVNYIVAPCSGCGGTGTRMKETSTTVRAGEAQAQMSSDAFKAAVEGSLDSTDSNLDNNERRLVSRTMQALWPPRLTELVRTSVPATKIKGFLEQLAKATEEYTTQGPKPGEEEGGVPRGLQNVGGYNCMILKAERGKGKFVKFGFPVDEVRGVSSKRHIKVAALAEKFRNSGADINMYFEAKEDPENYILRNATQMASTAYDQVKKSAITPERRDNLIKMLKQDWETFSPEAQSEILNGYGKGNRSELLQILRQSSDEPSMGPGNVTPWLTRTILRLKNIRMHDGTQFGSLDQIKSMAREMDDKGRGPKFHEQAALAYLLASQSQEIEPKEFFADTPLMVRYILQIRRGNMPKIGKGEQVTSSIAYLTCESLSGGEVVLQYDLEKNPDQILFRVWPLNRLKDMIVNVPKTKEQQAKEYERLKRPRAKKAPVEAEPEVNQNALSAQHKKKLMKLGFGENVIRTMERALTHGKIGVVANRIGKWMRNRDGRTIDAALDALPVSVHKAVKHRLGLAEGKFADIWAIAEEIDTDRAGDVISPAQIADWID